MTKKNKNFKKNKLLENRTFYLMTILLAILLLITIYWIKNNKNINILVSASANSKKQNEEHIDAEIISNSEDSGKDYKNNTSYDDKEQNNKEIDSNLTDWELILINKNNKIPDYYGMNLINIENEHLVDERIAEALQNMLKDARKQKLSPLICSSYRTHQKQEELYTAKTNSYIWQGYGKAQAEDLASYWVAIPGTGEHQTGLAVDIVSKKYQILDEKQEQTKEQQWLIENSYRYGFILRYPTEKREITMINYEPWHYRYVGVKNATFMKEKGFCLEEYIDYLKKFEQN